MGSNSSLRQQKKRQTQQRLQLAARQLFSTTGIDSTSLDAIASAAQVSRATLFNYYPSKSALVAALADQQWQQLVTIVQLQTAFSSSLEDRILRIFHQANDLLAEAPLGRDLLLFNQTLQPHPNTDRLHAAFAGLMQHAVSRNEITIRHTAAATQLLHTCFLGMVFGGGASAKLHTLDEVLRLLLATIKRR